MRCISPVLIQRSTSRDFVPCGKCNFCLSTRRNEWTFRIKQEAKVSNSQVFLTLTYDEEHVKRNPDSSLPEVSKQDLQLFTKRLRKSNAPLSDLPLRYYSVAEYGTKTRRPHYHSIMFNLDRSLLATVSDVWGLGLCHIGHVTDQSIHYVTKYVINRHDDYNGMAKPFALMSRRPGIGANYLTTHTQWHQDAQRNFTNVNGQIGSLPRYYKEKIFSPFQREALAKQSIRESDERYADTISKLANFSPEPFNYYDERLAQSLDTIKNKTNQFNTL